MLVNLRNFWAQLAHVPQTLRLIWEAARGWTLAWALLLIVAGLLPAATVYLTRPLVDSLTSAMGSGGAWKSIEPVLFYGGLMVGAIMLADLVQSVNGWVSLAQAELVRDHLSGIIHEKCAAVDIAFYESPEYYDSLDRVQNNLNTRPLALLESAGSLVQNSITLVSVGVLLIPYGLWMPMALVLSTVPALFVVVVFNRRLYEWWHRSTPRRRRARYFESALIHGDVAAELRLFGLGSYFRSAYQELRRRLRNEQLKLTRDQSLARLGAGFCGLLISGGAMSWIIWQGFQGRASFGDLALFYHALSRGQSLLHSLLRSLGQIYSNTLFLGDLFKFLALVPQVADPAHPVATPERLNAGICFRGVDFCYPGSDRHAVQNFNLTIPAGKITAIVGQNGAGKSTVIKLLCRFYDPARGSVEIDGTDIRNYSLYELRNLVTVLFQWPVPYQMTAAENIAIADLRSSPDRARIESAARAAGVHGIVERLPNGYESQLGKWFANGTELSQGEWQRLALARAFLKQAQIIILDEPTSSLDSWSENDWFDRFQSFVGDRTAVIVTHRLTIARRADVIHVMGNGHLLESGRHDELLQAGGTYAESWLAQVESPGVAKPQVVRSATLGRIK